jgi:hypothetical protein
MRPVLTFPFSDPNGRMFSHLQAILPDLKKHFEHAYICPPLATATCRSHAAVAADDFFTVFQ